MSAAREGDHVRAPRQSMYRLGRAVEYRARDYLAARGWVVMRSPASKSPIDLVAVRLGEAAFIQCKRSGSLPPKEWNELYELAFSVGATPICCAQKPTGGLEWFRLKAKKTGGRGQRQPWERIDPRYFGAIWKGI